MASQSYTKPAFCEVLVDLAAGFADAFSLFSAAFLKAAELLH
jgi:hypothetical protein